ncbi:hypothetical protein OUZ56_028240 [Daphnia magna]|uniref:Secreted protein n=1 Tax=Daphnia magna TaxID=35525 RepID=A0ABR0B397_9CRUS|nr:hypothetical protein OUZ56_028240 [Daphnia magna]
MSLFRLSTSQWLTFAAALCVTWFINNIKLLLVTNVWGSLAFSPAKLERCGASRSCPNRAECLVRPVRNQQTPIHNPLEGCEERNWNEHGRGKID